MIKTQQLLLQREPIKTSSPRSEHSQGGAQRSEQYLYGAQRATKWGIRFVFVSDIAFPIFVEYAGIGIVML
jgi:hypothetical protein